jgi:hypothetical protein
MTVLKKGDMLRIKLDDAQEQRTQVASTPICHSGVNKISALYESVLHGAG